MNYYTSRFGENDMALDRESNEWKAIMSMMQVYLGDHNNPEIPSWNEGRWDRAGAMWDILSALRGPDSDRQEVKEATTEVVRYTLVKLARPGYSYTLPGGPIVARDSAKSLATRQALTGFVDGPFTEAQWTESRHFIGHAMRAFKALGLKWDEVNEP